MDTSHVMLLELSTWAKKRGKGYLCGYFLSARQLRSKYRDIETLSYTPLIQFANETTLSIIKDVWLLPPPVLLLGLNNNNNNKNVFSITFGQLEITYTYKIFSVFLTFT